jgi:Na+(H+)/acetate symporter ActP
MPPETSTRAHPKRPEQVAAAHPRRARPQGIRLAAVLAVLDAAYVLAFFVMAGDVKAGIGLLASANALLAVMDWNAFVSLGGLFPWRQLGVAARIALVVVLLSGCVALPMVLVRSLHHAWWRERPRSIEIT